MKIVKRYTVSSVGWYFGEPIKHFENVGIQISILHSCNLVIFEYYGKKHRLKLYKGRYGLHFRFGNTTYYLEGSE